MTKALTAATEQPRKRPIGRPFQKGTSGNPGGRLRGELSVLQEKYGPRGERLHEALEAALVNPKTPTKIKVEIAEWLIERMHGRARQHVDVDASGDLLALVLAAAVVAEGEPR